MGVERSEVGALIVALLDRAARGPAVGGETGGAVPVSSSSASLV
jgi:hypothetical protein